MLLSGGKGKLFGGSSASIAQRGKPCIFFEHFAEAFDGRKSDCKSDVGDGEFPLFQEQFLRFGDTVSCEIQIGRDIHRGGEHRGKVRSAHAQFVCEPGDAEGAEVVVFDESERASDDIGPRGSRVAARVDIAEKSVDKACERENCLDFVVFFDQDAL